MYGKHINNQQKTVVNMNRLLLSKKNNVKPLVLLDAEAFVKLHNSLPKEYTIDELLKD